MFLQLMNGAFGWEVPAEPSRVVGPLYFVGTQGLGVYYLNTSDGGILINTGMPTSGPMIEESIRKLGFDPAGIRLLLAGHGHIDHVGGHAYMKSISGAEIAMMEPDVALVESGGNSDFYYGNEAAFGFEGVTVQRILRDGERVVLGDVAIEALMTSGHTRGATTFVMELRDDGKSYRVVIPDGTGVNPGYRVGIRPTYPGAKRDYQATYHVLETLEPDIWLPLHNETADLMRKIEQSKAEGVAAFVDPLGYEAFVRKQRATFEGRVDAERAESP